MRSSACFEIKTDNKNHRMLANNLGAESWEESLSFLTKLEQNPEWIFFNEIPIENSCQLVSHFYNEWKANLPWKQLCTKLGLPNKCQSHKIQLLYIDYMNSIEYINLICNSQASGI